jgi:hypothetical protein
VSTLDEGAHERKHQEVHNTVALSPEDDLYVAGQKLRAHRELHQIPIIDVEQKSVLSVMTHRRLLQYLCSNLKEQRRLFDQPIIELRIGTFEGIKTVSELPLSAAPSSYLCSDSNVLILMWPLFSTAGRGGNPPNHSAEHDDRSRCILRPNRDGG